MQVRGTIVQAPSPDQLVVLDDHVITVDEGGTIVAVEPFDPAKHLDVDSIGAGHVLMPGLIDTHVHAPQWPQLGAGLDLPLDRWLQEYTFPLEVRFHDLGFAQQVWDHMVPTLLQLGTTTAVYYGSIHNPATTALAQTCASAGQRAFIGRVAMDDPDGNPEWYRDDSAASSVDASAASIEAIRGIGSSLVQPIVTPRFIPSCSVAALEGLAELADATGTLVQTHCSESDWQHQFSINRFGMTDAAALDRFGLIRDHTVLAHATHLTDDDRSLLIAAGAGVAHCPLSNSYFANAVFPARRNIEAGMRVGLGTDIAGGPTASLVAQCGHAVTSARMLEDGVDVGDTAGRDSARISMITALWMATVGGADLLGLPIGLLEPGRQFDAISVSLSGADGVRGWADIDDAERIFEKTMRSAQAGAVDRVWVDGQSI